MIRAAILTEAGDKVGFGHISRCRALKSALDKNGFETTVFINPQEVFRVSEEELLLNWQLEHPNCFDVFIVDSYLAPLDFYKNLPKESAKLFFDDSMRLDYPEGIVLNGAFGAENLYERKQHTLYLLGKNYLLLRDAFQHKKIKTHKEIKKILITLGAKDIRKLSGKIVDAIRANFPEIEISQIITDSYENLHDGVTYYKNLSAQDVASAMLKSDIAITAGGQSLLELCASAIPTISIQIADNQKNNIAFLAEEGLTQNIGKYDDSNLMQKLVLTIHSLDCKRRERISRELGEKIDFEGGERIAHSLQKEFLRKKLHKNLNIKNLHLTNFINLTDTEKHEILEWRNSEIVAKNMIDSTEITLQAHLNFLDNLKNRSDKFYFKVENLGVITIENIDCTHSSAELGIYKNPSKSAVGKILLEACESVIFDVIRMEKIELKVKKENKIAISLYEKNGYDLVQISNNLLEMEKRCQR